MSWRLRKQEAGSGALGDLGSHAVDQVRFLTGVEVTSVSATSRTFVTRRPGPRGEEEVSVDDAMWSTLQLENGAVASVEATRMATGRKNALRIEMYGSLGALSFDLESLNHLQVYSRDAPAGSRDLGPSSSPNRSTHILTGGGPRATCWVGPTPSRMNYVTSCSP